MSVPRWWCRLAHQDSHRDARGLDLHLVGAVLWTAWCVRCRRHVQWRTSLGA